MVNSLHPLVAAARRHAPDAWNTLLKQHQLPLYTYAAELVADAAVARDIVQETFAAAVRHIATLRDDARFGQWLFGIAHQKCVQHWRRQQRDAAVFEAPDNDSACDGYADGEENDPRATLLRQEEAELFFSALEQLSRAHRSVLLLHIIEEFSLEEIAHVTGTPVGTVKSRLHHAKRSLRHIVEART